MSPVAFLSALLMLGSLRGAAESDLRLCGKAVYSDETLLGSNDARRTTRTQPYQPMKNEISRSLDFENFNKIVVPTTSKISFPSIKRLYPPTAKPLHLHANMPMRFGRESSAGDERSPNSAPNLPQRFGRSWGMTQTCSECLGLLEAPDPVQSPRLRKNTLDRSLLRTLANAQLLHWADEFDLTTSAEEVEMQEKRL